MKTLELLCESFQKTRVLVVGDVILDRFVYGSVDRISPESPVPVLAMKREATMLGGAGNALANLVGLGVQASFLSVIGRDFEGERIKEQIIALGVDSAGLICDPSRPTSVKTRFLAGHQQLLRSDFEKLDKINDATSQAVLDAFEGIIGDMNAIILSDYGKGVLRVDLMAHMISTARARNIPILVDPKGHDFSIYRGATAVTPNRKELSEATRSMPTISDVEIEMASNHIIESCGIDAVFATRSQDGISVIHRDQPPCHIRPTKAIEVFDVSGAGDTVIATIATALAAGSSFEDAAHLANLAGSIAVTKVGTAPIRLQELQDAITQADDIALTEAFAPVLEAQAAADQVKRWHARGLKVGFTNGCFDIIHAGHVTYLHEARTRCDRLIVGLNHDDSVRILKGADRPVHDERARATVLGALSSVDMVVLFGAQKAGDDNTANALLTLLKPDMYFKGGDYCVDDIPETPAVRSYGGCVEVLSVVDGYSTTNAITKIRKTALN